MSQPNRRLMELSSQIVAARAAYNHTAISELPSVITIVYSTLAELAGNKPPETPPSSHRHTSEVHPEHDDSDLHGGHAENGYVHPEYGQTVFGDRLVCMEDGLTMKMLKRHLLTVHGLTPELYRKKWGLPDDYPMVASDYARLRSSLAVESGLGLKPEDRAKVRRTRS